MQTSAERKSGRVHDFNGNGFRHELYLEEHGPHRSPSRGDREIGGYYTFPVL